MKYPVPAVFLLGIFVGMVYQNTPEASVSAARVDSSFVNSSDNKYQKFYNRLIDMEQLVAELKSDKPSKPLVSYEEPAAVKQVKFEVEPVAEVSQATAEQSPAVVVTESYGSVGSAAVTSYGSNGYAAPAVYTTSYGSGGYSSAVSNVGYGSGGYSSAPVVGQPIRNLFRGVFPRAAARRASRVASFQSFQPTEAPGFELSSAYYSQPVGMTNRHLFTAAPQRTGRIICVGDRCYIQ